MDQRLSEQLNKVLALADSSHDGEALVAIRKARQILSKDGLSFGDLAIAAAMRVRRNMPFSFFAHSQDHLEAQIVQLRSRIDALQQESATQAGQAEFWRQRAIELEQSLNVRRSEAQRWRRLAQETVDKLWDIGREVRRDEFAPIATVAGAAAEKVAKTAAK